MFSLSEEAIGFHALTLVLLQWPQCKEILFVLEKKLGRGDLD